MTTAPLAFLNPVTSVDSSGTQDTIIVDQRTVTSSTARFGADSSFTAAVAPAAAAGASRLLTGGVRNFIDINNPTDGSLIYIGPASITAATGVPLYPGSKIQITGYIGEVWVIAANGNAVTFFYRTS